MRGRERCGVGSGSYRAKDHYVQFMARVSSRKSASIMFARLARPETYTRARGPFLQRCRVSRSAHEGSFLSGYYLAAEDATARIKQCSSRIFRLRLIGLNPEGYEVRLHQGEQRQWGP